MRDAEFQDAVDLVIDIEGGDKLHRVRGDPGGLTKFGISKRAYPNFAISKLTRIEAEALYQRDYWPALTDDLPPGVALMLFDASVNQGKVTAIRLAQLLVRAKGDGILGHKTVDAIALLGRHEFLLRYATARLDRYRNTKGAGRFFIGWARRVLRVYLAAMT